MMLLTYKYRINPEKRQHRALERILDQQRQLYNAALEERIDAFRKLRRTISDVDQSRSLTAIRADDPSYASVQRRIQRETLKRLDRAYKSFFRRAKAGAGASSGFPKFKGIHFFDGFGFDAFQQIKLYAGGLRFAGMPGKLRVHFDRPLPQVRDPETGELVTDIRNVWFKRDGARWFVGFQVAAPVRESRDGLGQGEIGVDWGTSVLAALSSGETIANPRPGETMADDLRRAQRSLARKRKGSRGRRKALSRLQQVHARIANRRRTHLDKVASRLVKHWGLVAIEDLTIKDLMSAERPGETLPEFVHRRRNREALDAAPYMLRQMITYKAQREGARVVAVDPKHTTQRCSFCGGLHFKELMDAEHVCTAPGVYNGRRLPRKVNAARVILQRARDEISSHADECRGGLVPGGLEGGNAPARNVRNGVRRLGNTEGGQPPPGQRGARPRSLTQVRK